MPVLFRALMTLVVIGIFTACHAFGAVEAGDPENVPAKRAPRKLPAGGPVLAAWVEPDFPFFSSVLDARKAGADLPKDNLTPRGLVLNLGRDFWACFDPDLLRMSVVWRGKGVTPKALAPGSYIDGSRKTGTGETNLPTPVGSVWLANGIYAGWQTGGTISLHDPREPAPSPEEVGRGPIAESLGRFNALRLLGDGVVLDYTVGAVRVREENTVAGEGEQATVERRFEVAPSKSPLRLVLGRVAEGMAVRVGTAPGDAPAVLLSVENAVWTAMVPAHSETLAFVVALAPKEVAVNPVPKPLAARPPRPRWPQEVLTKVKRSMEKSAYVVDSVELPAVNPWKRGVRPGDIQFLRDGTGVMVTLDGDVWLAKGLSDASDAPRWRRFASGLHEPMSLAIRDDEIFVFDKNGIWKLRDTNGDGEADVHEMFSNAFGQTADMREFPATIRLAPGGEFVIAKGGQQATYEGKHNGSVLRVSADGRTSTVLGYGFRQPSIGVNPRTGLVTASDQEGPYVPSTPIQIVSDRQFYGFLAPFKPREAYPSPPAEPLTWVPHTVIASAISQIWLLGAKMGPLNDAMLQVSFNKPEIFAVLINDRTPRMQAAVVAVTPQLEFPPLNGSVNPSDGQLYVAGFQVLGWGNVIDVPAGLGRVRYTGAPSTLPRAVVPMKDGVLLTFDVALDPKAATDPASYSLQTWSYRRTYKYGSAQYKLDGTPGQDALVASSAYLSQDRRQVFVGVPGMEPVQQLRMGWALTTAVGGAFTGDASTTVYQLAAFDSVREGFGEIKVDLTPRVAVAEAAGPVTVEEGKRLAQLFACVACHADVYNPVSARSGPPWQGLYGKERPVFIEGKKTAVLADDEYLRESILAPTAKIAAGFEKGEYAMPSFAGVLSETQVESLILYIKSLR